MYFFFSHVQKKGLPIPSPKLINFLDRSSGDSANISECESKMGDSLRDLSQGDSLLQGTDQSMNMSSDGEGDRRVR